MCIDGINTFMIALSGIQVVDLFFRFSTVGLLFGAIALIWHAANRVKSNTTWPNISFLLCIVGYILLTAPIDDHHYGGLRQVLLLVTDVTAFAILWLTLSLLDPKFSLFKANQYIVIPIYLYLLWLVYFFLVFGGYGILHDVNHAIGLSLFVYVIYLCLNEYFDDLDNQRRNARLLLIALCVGYMCALTLFEFVLRDVRNTWQFSLLNSIFTFLLVGFYFVKKTHSFTLVVKTPTAAVKQQSEQVINLNEVMTQGAFLKTNLTIGELAEQLEMPEHQLRLVINQELGFSNFSHYLNSYRIPHVCDVLKDPEKSQTPILTIALETGYGSIAPFNRAFKQQMGMTPTQYRNQF